MIQLLLCPSDPAAELAYAKSLPEGMELSPAAQALYEQEGVERFRKFHGRLSAAFAAVPPGTERQRLAEGSKPNDLEMTAEERMSLER